MPQITGTPGNDDLTGTPGDDQINGLAGADHMAGLAGNDIYFVDDAGDVIIEANGEGTDIVYASVGFTLNAGAYIELLTTPSIASTNPVDMTGNELDNTIWGNNGANTLSGGVGGHDTLVGFLGNDIYLINNTDEVVVENAGEGTDIVYVNSSYTLSKDASIELLSTYSIAGTQAYELTGNNLDNTIWGNRGNNTLSGGFGGHDTLVGFQGNDIYLINNTDEVIVENEGEGTDIVYVNSSYTLSKDASIELLSTFSIAGTQPYNMTGNNLSNTIWGNRGDNTLSGGIGGSDTLVGFLGNDTYLINNGNEVISELAGEGTDIVYANVSYVLSAGVSIELLSTNSIGGTNIIHLTGNELVNTLWGNDGENILDGGAGNDTLTGFGGSDYFGFSTPLGPTNVDTITDFNSFTDKILLDGRAGSPFAALATGPLRPGNFINGTAALEGDDYIIFNPATGALFYDADGNGAGAAIQFATLSNQHLPLNQAIILVAGPENQQSVVTSPTTGTIAENSPISTIVYQASGFDPDGDHITFEITGGDASKFRIDASGAVRLWEPANFEVQSSYGFFIKATDSNTTSDPIHVTISVTDVAENTTPIVNETTADNDSYFVAQVIDRNVLLTNPNPNLPDDTLPSLTIQGSISSSRDVDYYNITLQAGELLRLDVDGTNGLNSHLFVYYATQRLFGDNDDSDGPNDPGSNPPFDHNTNSSISFRAPTTGTFYFKIVPFDPASFTPTTDGSYKINVSVGPVGTPAQITRENVDALISGDFWDHHDLTFSFPQAASDYPNDPQGNRFEEIDQLNAALPNFDNFQGFSGLQISATQALLQIVASVTQLTFSQNSAQPGQANLRYAMSDEAEVAYAYYPTNAGPSSVGGTAWFNNTEAHFDNPIRGNYAWMGILHETGHALGLKHGHEFPWAISLDKDTIEYSVMTYRSYVDGDLEGYSNEQYGYAQTLMQYDIAALQKIYGGANYTFNASDSLYKWDEGTGEMTINGVPQGAPGNGVGGNANRILMTIWDGGGNDTYDLSNYANATTIDLRPGEWTKTSDVQIADLGDGRFARGNIANALLYLDNPTSLIENARAGSGNDTLIANRAANHLTGGGGSDIFKWAAIGDAGTGALADTIDDFVSGTDKINFALLDANPATAGHDAFTFIGNTAFHNIAGEVRFDVIGGSAHIFADVDGNGTADMEIIANGITILAASDFIF